MKRKFTKVLSLILAAFMVLTLCNFGAADVEAGTKKWKKKVYMTTDGWRSYSSNWYSQTKTRASVNKINTVYVYLPGYGDKVANLKLKNGIAKVEYTGTVQVKNRSVSDSRYKKTVTQSYTYYETEYYYETEVTGYDDNGKPITRQVQKSRQVPKKRYYSYTTTNWDKYYAENYVSYARIAYKPSKTGKLTMSFKVKKSNNKYRSKKKYKYNILSGVTTSVYSKVTFGGNTIFNEKTSYNKKKGTSSYTSTTNYKISGSGGKIYVKGANGYKITGLVVVTTGANGKSTARNVKNGGYAYTSTQYASSGYFSNGDIHYAPQKKYTKVLISYKDTRTGTYTKYKVVKKGGIKVIKYDTKYSDGTKYTYYYQPSNAGSTFTLWDY